MDGFTLGFLVGLATCFVGVVMIHALVRWAGRK